MSFLKVKTCPHCNIEFTGRKHSSFCSDGCKKSFEANNSIKLSHEKYNESNLDDWIECPCCKLRSSQLSGQHFAKHGYATLDDFKKAYPKFNIISETTRKWLSEKIKGDKNPACDHDGRLSPFSPKFHKYVGKSQEEIQEIIDSLVKQANTNRIENHNNSTSVEYFIKRGATPEEAEQLLSQRQSTFSMDKCIEKHGVEKGTAVWKDRQDRWLSKLNSKSDEEKEEINRKKIYRNGCVSKDELKLKKELELAFGNPLISQHIVSRNNGKHYVYDILYENKIIEYNGDLWHANPKKYSENDVPKFPRNEKTAKEIWSKDLEKNNFAIENGYSIFVVWESDYKSNKKDVIKQCIDYLNQ